MMKKKIFLSAFGAALIVGCANLFVSAQTGNDFQENAEANVAAPNRAQILRSLGLNAAQLRRIRQVNREFQPPLRQARQRMRAANLALDEAVYGGAPADEAIVQARLGEAQAAHAAWLAARTASERAIVEVLNPAQLARFRELQLARQRANAPTRRISNQTAPLPQRLSKLRRALRVRRNLRRTN